jgi:hypothetical protein
MERALAAQAAPRKKALTYIGGLQSCLGCAASRLQLNYYSVKNTMKTGRKCIKFPPEGNEMRDETPVREP